MMTLPEEGKKGRDCLSSRRVRKESSKVLPAKRYELSGRGNRLGSAFAQARTDLRRVSWLGTSPSRAQSPKAASLLALRADELEGRCGWIMLRTSCQFPPSGPGCCPKGREAQLEA